MSKKHYLETLRHQMECAAEEALPPDEEPSFRHMFGGMGVYARGRMFASLSDAGLALKLGTEDQTKLLEEEGARRLQYEEDGPVSKTYVVVPMAVAESPGSLGPWVLRSIQHTASLPAQKGKRKGSRRDRGDRGRSL